MRLPVLFACLLSALALGGGSASAIDSSGGIPRGSGSECDTTRKGGFIGIGGDSFRYPAERECILGLQALAGAGVIRATMDWEGIEKTKGVYEWAEWDTWLRSAAPKGMHVLPILFNTPAFYGKASPTGSYPPRSTAPFARFAREAVERYGSNGSFWSDNPDVPKLPITTWQIWNEQNLKQYWRPKPNAKAYVKLLKAAYQAIKGADRRAQVVTGGMPDSLQGGAVRLLPYVTQLYNAGGAKYFDILAANLYGTSAKAVIQGVKDLRLIMNAPKVKSLVGKFLKAKPKVRAKTLKKLIRALPRSQRKKNLDPRAPIWITEVGWGTGGPSHRFNIGASKQAKEIGKLFKGLYKQRRKLKVRGIVYFGWQDQEPYPPAFNDMWGLHTGLFTRAGDPKPGYRAFRDIAPKLK